MGLCATPPDTQAPQASKWQLPSSCAVATEAHAPGAWALQ